MVEGGLSRVQGSEYRFQGSGFRVQGSGFRGDGDLCGRCCNCERNKEMIVWQGRTLQLHRAVS